ncbi:MAG: hypothetical protein LBF27_25690 [Sphingobacterium sp.]|jgi:hypothetical protein|nr:hypothetical protein [Sphingobacterium sp.]
MDKLYRQVSVKERLPEKSGRYHTNVGLVYYHGKEFYHWIDWWLEEVELPSEEEITTNVLFHNNTMYHDNDFQKACDNGIKMCFNYILNTLKGEKSNG